MLVKKNITFYQISDRGAKKSKLAIFPYNLHDFSCYQPHLGAIQGGGATERLMYGEMILGGGGAEQYLISSNI